MDWLPKQTVVVPFDFSEPSIEAIRLAKDMVENPSGLHVLHVLLGALLAESAGAPLSINDEERAANASHAIESQLTEQAIDGATTAVRIGSPGIEIADYAKEVNADLIVIPSHGRTGLKHLLIGSVAERVARHAPCPVLILRRGM